MNFDKIINDYSLKKVNNYYLYERDIQVLKKYHIPYKNCQTIQELLFFLNNLLNDDTITDDELNEIEQTSINISELAYYHYTNK